MSQRGSPLDGHYVIRGLDGTIRIVEPTEPGAVLYERLLEVPQERDLRTAAMRKYHLDADTLFIALGRMSRDGWSMERIRAETDLPVSLVSNAVLENGMRIGRQMLAERNAHPPDHPKYEPLESVVAVNEPWVEQDEDDE